MPRYVILRHETPADVSRGTHWDFMLEGAGMLRTWALDDLPAPGQTVAATSLSDHRLAYLDYEGPVSGNRGEVTRFDRGEYELLEDTPNRLHVALSGERLQGHVVFTRAEDLRHWSVTFARPPA